jgi:nucleoside-diphosphate-sugar epimerase
MEVQIVRVFLTGATSQVGRFLLPQLLDAGHEVLATSRQSMPDRERLSWVMGDLSDNRFSCPLAQALVHIAPLHLLPKLLPDFLVAGGKRVICFGTTSRYSKSASSDPQEQALVRAQVAAEARVAELCEAAGADWTLFRPTLIYGAGTDRNVTLIAHLIRRFGVFPLFGKASGLRQPVHADDLAVACMAALSEPRSFNRAYDLTGDETLSYRQMVERIFASEGRRPRFVNMPLGLFAAVIWCVSRIPRFKDLNSEMVRRMNEDLVYDSSSAVRDFGFSPRGFEPG